MFLLDSTDPELFNCNSLRGPVVLVPFCSAGVVVVVAIDSLLFATMATSDRFDTQNVADCHIGFLGSGLMAQGIMRGLIQSGLIKGSQVTMTDKVKPGQPNFKPIEAIVNKFGIEYLTENVPMAAKSDVIFLCVKPNIVETVLKECAGVIADKLVVSIAAGITIETLEQTLPVGTHVIRVMPNMPCVVQQGAGIFARGHCASDADVQIMKTLLSVIIPVLEEIPQYQFNAATALSGCGPAYICLVIESLTDGAVRLGLTRDMAHRLAVQTVLGTAVLARESGIHPAQLRDQICSPGGSTIAGTFALEKAGVRAAFSACVEAAKIRNDELGAPRK
ncbi:Pyrroline-5-carboxylate reductase 3 [Taenia crassiceps]|uniref:Pyrroline-5-carboxylate reductase 3 n=1 Tax=Taenia crassiceps TaxID=6207 RepID=A0ABR4QFY2_9CEST